MQCSRCGQEIVNPSNSFGTGYAKDKDGRMFCYACCGKLDKEHMLKHGVIILYLTRKDGQDIVCNWPNTLSFPAVVTQGKHNIAGTQAHAYFIGPDGKLWHGRQYGRGSELCRCKRLKTPVSEHWSGRYLR